MPSVQVVGPQRKSSARRYRVSNVAARSSPTYREPPGLGPRSTCGVGLAGLQRADLGVQPGPAAQL